MSVDNAIDLSNPCNHVSEIRIREVERPGKACVDCLKIHGHWVHLRECLTCGHVACCDSSPHRHASKHAHATSHPIITSLELGETWAYCYPHDSMLS
jgi:hypothetical protein